MLPLLQNLNKRLCISMCIFVAMCGLTVPLYTVWQYRIDQHEWFFSRNILDLPARDDAFFNTRRLDYDGWTPGSPKWLVDITELQSKSPRNVTMTGHHEIIYYNTMPAAHLAIGRDLLKTCPYTNCHITDNRERFDEASGVLFEISHHRVGLPPRSRPDGQIWIFTELEPPIINGVWDHRHRSWTGKFNWTITHRFDSDIIRTNGYLTTRKPDEIPQRNYHEIYTRKTKFAAWFVSSCRSVRRSYRAEYVEELQQYIPVDIYGACGTKPANRSMEGITELLSEYKFYLSFENSFCFDYVTEKFFYYFNLTDAVLVVRGGADYDQLLPEYTHINTQHFSNATELATYLLSLNSSEQEYTKYLKARDQYNVSTKNWACTLCMKLNDKASYPRVYNDIVGWWHVDKCWNPTDIVTNGLSGRYLALIMFMASIAIGVCVVKLRLRRPT